MILLGVNIDHVATVRQARGTDYPSLIEAALSAEDAGADFITLHLREDRRHIQDRDVVELRRILRSRMNLESAVTAEMIRIASGSLSLPVGAITSTVISASGLAITNITVFSGSGSRRSWPTK